MADEVAATVESAPQAQPAQDVNTRLQSAAWGEAPIQAAQPQQTETPIVEVPQGDAAQTPTIEEEIFDENDYVKNKYGYDNADALINEIKTLKEKSSKSSWEWKDDKAKQIAEAINEGNYDPFYDWVSTQKQLEKLTTADLNANQNLAAELVKFGIQKDNPNLSQDEIEFVFGQKYTLPEKPIQDEIETDSQYEARVNNWQNHINNIERQLVIDAKIQQPKLAQLKSELVFPQIQKEQQPQSNQPSQKDLEVYKERENAFIQSAQQSLENFKGISYNVKDKDVDYTVSYAPSEEGMNLIASKIQEFINSGMNANALLAQRWVNADQTVNTDLMVKDLSLIFEGEKIVQKFATDSASKRVEAYLKEKKQVSVTGNQPQGTFVPSNAQSKFDKIREQAFA